MICVEGIKKSFGDLTVLKGIDLNVQNKEFVCIVGPSGAGKTTLLQILGSLYKPDEGSIRINGIDILSLSRKEIAKFRNRHIGFIFQFHQLLPEFNALENIMLPGLIAGKPSKEVQTRAKELLAYMGLSERATHKPSELSGGEKQRVAVARALLNQPSIILADEPSGSLDSQNKEELYKLFFKLRQEFGLTFVIVTHDETLSELADRTIHMLDGNIISTDTTTFTNDTIRTLE